jgi:hypothetical protein
MKIGATVIFMSLNRPKEQPALSRAVPTACPSNPLLEIHDWLGWIGQWHGAFKCTPRGHRSSRPASAFSMAISRKSKKASPKGRWNCILSYGISKLMAVLNAHHFIGLKFLHRFKSGLVGSLMEVIVRKIRPIQFGLIVNLIQMKWTKVIDTRKNMMSEEFQHCSESQLIEVMILKMHPIQFGLIMNLIQMKPRISISRGIVI